MSVPDALLAGGLEKAAAALARLATEKRAVDWSSPAMTGLAGAGLGATIGGLGGALAGRYGPRDRDPWRSGLTGALAGAGIGGGLGLGVPAIAGVLRGDDPRNVSPGAVAAANKADLVNAGYGPQVIDQLNEIAKGTADPEVTKALARKGGAKAMGLAGDFLSGAGDAIGEGVKSMGPPLAEAAHGVSIMAGDARDAARNKATELSGRVLPTTGALGGAVLGQRTYAPVENARLTQAFRGGMAKNAPEAADDAMKAIRNRVVASAPSQGQEVIRQAIAAGQPVKPGILPRISRWLAGEPAFPGKPNLPEPWGTPGFKPGPAAEKLYTVAEGGGYVRPSLLRQAVGRTGRGLVGGGAGLVGGLMAERAFGQPTWEDVLGQGQRFTAAAGPQAAKWKAQLGF